MTVWLVRRSLFCDFLTVILALLVVYPPSVWQKRLTLEEHELLAEQRGTWQPIHDDGEVIGAIVCTQSNLKPVYVSVGHQISLKSAIAFVLKCFVLKCALKYRLPETTRQEDQLSKGHTNLSLPFEKKIRDGQ
jgi:deoxyinosine 3'endonuclease (endonuclease V)